jgi:hypothetical protein
VPHPSVRQLLGKWTTDPGDVDSLSAYERASLEFKKDGQLIYTIHAEESNQIMILTYKIRENMLVTNQLSAPGEERTAFAFTDDGKLKLEFGGIVSTYIREG